MSEQHTNQIRVCHLCMEECGTLKGGLILEDISFPQKCAKSISSFFPAKFSKSKGGDLTHFYRIGPN